MRRLRSGFTLVELVAALAVAGFAMLGGVLLLDQIGDSAQRIARDGAEAPREGNGARLLVRLLADARANEDTTKRFSGDAHTLTFWSSCDVPGGWMEPCRVTLAIDLRGDSSTVRASLSTGEALALRTQPGAAEFRYFAPTKASDSAWFRDWSSNTTLPSAVGIVRLRDTMVVPVAARD